jgi:uncharacterized membrane protein
MRVQEGGNAKRVREAHSPAVVGKPPVWLIIALASAYVVALAALAFLPGATLIERLRALDGGVCAQLPSHSFFPGGTQLPLCARDSGTYLGFASAVVILWVSGRGRASRLPPLPIAIVLLLAVAVFGFDGFNSLFNDLGLPHLYQPHNLLRVATGLGTGTAMAAFIVPVANGLIWRKEDARSSFGSFRELALMVPVLLLDFLAVSSPSAFMLYPMALITSAGLLVAVTTVNLVFVLGIGNRVGRFGTWRHFFPIFTLTK